MISKPRFFRIGEAETERVEAFSDGVFAVAITLLILDVKLPPLETGDDAQIWSAIAGLLHGIGAWALSFGFVFMFWIAHHYLFQQMTRVDRGILWLNGLFLLTLSFTPFPTGLLAHHPNSKAATFLLAGAMFTAAATFSLLRWYASYGGRLLAPDPSPDAVKAAMIRSLIAPAVYAAAMGAALVSPLVSILLQAAVIVIYLFPSALERRPEQSPP